MLARRINKLFGTSKNVSLQCFYSIKVQDKLKQINTSADDTSKQINTPADNSSNQTNVSTDNSSSKEQIKTGLELVKEATEIYAPEKVTKKDLQWRTPWHEKEGQYYGVLRVFYSEDNGVETSKFLQTPINLTPTGIKNWWKRKQEQRNIIMQGYIPDRNRILGNELAAAHFIVYRGGAVKFFGEDKWVKADEYQNYSLPIKYNAEKVLQAIDCSDMELYYEGLVNLKDLQQVEWLSFNGCEQIDDWCIDKISNIFSHSLLYLDLRNCQKVTYRGLGALHKIKTLKILYVDTMFISNEYEMTCLMLEELLPDLDIRIGVLV